MARRLVALLLTAAVLGSTVGVISTVIDPGRPASADVATDRPVYGRNSAVTIALGQIYFTPQCSTGLGDWIYPVADIYVIKGSTAPTGILTDVSGRPNTVFGVSGGGIFDEVIGYTKPAGAIGPGVYSIVVDECQDGTWGPEDTFQPAAFRVVSNVVGPQIPDIGSIKTKAAAEATKMKQAKWAWEKLVKYAEGKGPGAAGKAYGHIKNLAFGLGGTAVPNPSAIATMFLGAKAKSWEGLAADPPDPNFSQPTVLAPTAVPAVVHGDDPLEMAVAPSVGALANSAALSESLLHSLERYQGAREARDGEWQLAHARAIRSDSALLATQLIHEATALDALADAVDALPVDYDTEIGADLAAIDAFLAGGPDAAGRALLANEGVTVSQASAHLTQVRAVLAGPGVATLSADLRASAADAAGLATDLDTLATDMEAVVATLAADPFVEGTVPVVDAGGPYGATVGAPATLTGSATAGVDLAGATFAWDLDGDALFDDATGATPTYTPTAGFTGFAGLKVTTSGGESGVGYVPLTITGAPAGPVVTSSLPTDQLDLVVPAGSTQVFSVTATGTDLSTVWFLDGDEVATAASYDVSPTAADTGTHLVEAVISDSAGRSVSVRWFAQVSTPDADGDLYEAHVDCDDTEATTNPGAPDIADGIDNDCDPTSPDGGVAPVVSTSGPLAGPEGAALTLSRTFTHPTGTYTATIDWGDGVVEPGTVTGKTVTGTHTYADDGVFSIEVCVKASAGKTGCATNAATITNVAAGPQFSTLFDWTEEEAGVNDGVWTLDPDGRSVFQSINGDPTFFMSDADVPAGIEAGVNITVETTGDDDFIGFALGLQPGFIADPNADYLLVDWKKGDQSWAGCGGDSFAEQGLAVSRVHGPVDGPAMWSHVDCGPSSVIEMARGTRFGETGWVSNTTYAFRFRLTPDHLQIWVDGELEFDLAGDFPMGRLGFYNYSQSSVRYSGYQLVPGDVVEGTPRTYDVEFDDPGTADTHTGRIAWGDGSPDDALDITESSGEGTGSKAHNFLDDGSYDGEVCITDDDDGTACQQFPILVANAPPTVRAGSDKVAGPTLALDDSSFTDPGVLDTHTATVDWGDGSAVEAVTVSATMGEGIVDGEHTYVSDDTYTVTVCVLDDDGAEACDALEADVRTQNAAPAATTDDDVEVVEGSAVTRGVGFTDANPDDTHTASVDWGDGTAVEPIPLQTNGLIGAGGLAHTYTDDGVHTVTVDVCDSHDECDGATSTVTVTNADPGLALTVTPDPRVSNGITVGGTVTDAGVVDTHTATIDWGDGTAVTDAVVVAAVGGAGGGTLEGSHVYAAGGDYQIEVCVVDDDAGSVCQTVAATAGGLPPDPPTDVSAIGGDGNARVRWKAPLFTGGVALLQYEIETTPGATSSTLAAPGLSTVATGLVNDSPYSFRVRVSNEYGWSTWSEPSNLARPRPSCPGAPFIDVGADHPFCPEIKWMGDTRVSRGYNDGSYRPVSPITRQAMAAFSYRLLNPDGPTLPTCTAKPFTDVAVTNSFCPEIAWMKAQGITNGYPDGTFKPTAPVARQAMAAFLYRLDGSPSGDELGCTAAEFTDVAVTHPFCGEIRWLVGTGVTEGYADGSYGATNPVARQAMAAFIFRYNIYAGLIS